MAAASAMPAASPVPGASPVPAGSIARGPLGRRLFAWHRRAARDLAFRRDRDPYAVLVAETMAQQTQVARVDAAWAEFLDRFPSFAALAAAPRSDVIRAWAGLGYNRRAVGLQRAAAMVVAEHAGRLPGSVEALERLPGVGPYTARAIAAVGFGVPVAPVDTNVARIVGRLFAAETPDGALPATPPRRRLQALADSLVDPRRPGAWTHAMMDLGALVCRPQPRCGACPLRPDCGYARLAGGRTPATRRAARSPSARRPAESFEQTSRWLRGRLVARVREAADGEWLVIRGRLGRHDAAAVAAALDALERDGLVERDPQGRVRLPR